jgi:N,N'-diacetyllegionaminate synthase
MHHSFTYIIAELGNTHDGSLGQAKKLIHAAALAGADAVKIQTHIFSYESLENAPSPPYFSEESRKDYLNRVSFDKKDHLILKAYSENECGVDFISSPFCNEAVDLLEQVGLSTYKVPSGELTNIPLLEKIALTGKKVILSSGMSTEHELDTAIQIFLRHNLQPSVLQCTSEYPCRPENVGLRYISDLKSRYSLRVGLSDHTLGIAASLGAVTLGASIIEKHFTLSRLMYGSDASMSMEPAEFKSLVASIRDLELMLSSDYSKENAAKSLQHMKHIFEKSIVAAQDLYSGQVLSPSDLTLKKPGTGLASSELPRLYGKRLKVNLKKDAVLTLSDLE